MAIINIISLSISLNEVPRADVVVLAHMYHVRCVLLDGLLTSPCVSLFPEIVKVVLDSSSALEPDGGAP
jgi:hypothetical protein